MVTEVETIFVAVLDKIPKGFVALSGIFFLHHTFCIWPDFQHCENECFRTLSKFNSKLEKNSFFPSKNNKIAFSAKNILKIS